MSHPLLNKPAPEFKAPTHLGFDFSPSFFKGEKNLVLFFYPKDHSPGCTAEVCSFGENLSFFELSDTVVVGISPDSIESHKIFARKHSVNYPLIADVDGKINRLYQVPRDFMGLLPGRITFVVDRKGIIRGVFRSALQFTKHIEKAKEIISSLNS